MRPASITRRLPIRATPSMRNASIRAGTAIPRRRSAVSRKPPWSMACSSMRRGGCPPGRRSTPAATSTSRHSSPSRPTSTRPPCGIDTAAARAGWRHLSAGRRVRSSCVRRDAGHAGRHGRPTRRIQPVPRRGGRRPHRRRSSTLAGRYARHVEPHLPHRCVVQADTDVDLHRGAGERVSRAAHDGPWYARAHRVGVRSGGPRSRRTHGVRGQQRGRHGHVTGPISGASGAGEELERGFRRRRKNAAAPHPRRLLRQPHHRQHPEAGAHPAARRGRHVAGRPDDYVADAQWRRLRLIVAGAGAGARELRPRARVGRRMERRVPANPDPVVRLDVHRAAGDGHHYGFAAEHRGRNAGRGRDGMGPLYAPERPLVGGALYELRAGAVAPVVARRGGPPHRRRTHARQYPELLPQWRPGTRLGGRRARRCVEQRRRPAAGQRRNAGAGAGSRARRRRQQLQPGHGDSPLCTFRRARRLADGRAPGSPGLREPGGLELPRHQLGDGRRGTRRHRPIPGDFLGKLCRCSRHPARLLEPRHSTSAVRRGADGQAGGLRLQGPAASIGLLLRGTGSASVGRLSGRMGGAARLPAAADPGLCRQRCGDAGDRSSIPQSAWVLLFIVTNTTINLLGIETTARASRIFLAIQLVVIVVFIVLGVVAISRGVNGAHWSLEPLWSPGAFQMSFVFNALSVAVLSFLGFDAISTLAEEATGGGKTVGQATMISLCLAAVLFVTQTWIAALLIPGRTEFIGDTETNDAFYTVAAIAGGPALKLVAAISIALSAGIANALVAQAATSRLLFAIDRKSTRLN